MNKWWTLLVILVIVTLVWLWPRRPDLRKGVETRPATYSTFDEEMVALASEAVKLAKDTYYLNLDYSPESTLIWNGSKSPKLRSWRPPASFFHLKFVI